MRVIVFSLCLALGLSLAQVSAAAAQEDPPRLLRLHDDLHLSAIQEDAWRAYTAAVNPDPMTQARRQAAANLMPSLTTPRRIALIDATMSQDVDEFRRQGAAVKTFYADLTPDQQRTFDQETIPSTSQPTN